MQSIVHVPIAISRSLYGFLLLVSYFPDSICHVPGVKVKPFDTTGAGDCFIGSYAFFAVAGLDDQEAARRACVVASISVQKAGTQTSVPRASELPPELLTF